jgi:hypothetical protein
MKLLLEQERPRKEGQAAPRLQGWKGGEERGVGDVPCHATIMISIQKVLDDRLNSL